MWILKERKVPASHLVTHPGGFGEITNTAGLEIFNISDLNIARLGWGEWGKYLRRPRRQSGQNPIPVLGKWEDLISDSKTNHPGKLCDLSCRAAIAAGLRRGDLVNTSPSALVLMKEGPVKFAAKTKTRGKSEGRLWGACSYAFSTVNKDWIRQYYVLF